MTVIYKDMGPMADETSQRCSLPVRSLSSNTSAAAEVTEDRRLPPLPRGEPLPRGPFNLFTPTILAPSPPSSQDSFPAKSPWSSSDHIVAPPSPANSADSSWAESLQSQKALELPNELSVPQILELVIPQHINRKPPLQQLCGRKRKGSMVSGDSDDQREKHRIAEGNRRKNLSHLHRDLDSRLHDYFLQRAGWNPSKSLPESKEHIVQGAIYLIDFLITLVVILIRQENELPRHVSDRLQNEARCMQLQHLVSNLQQKNQSSQQQIKALKQENQILEERNQALELQLKSYEHMFRSPKTEYSTPQTLALLPDSTKARNMLPGLRVFCDEIAANSPDSSRLEAPHTGSSQSFAHGFLTQTPPMTGPSSPVFAPVYSVPTSRRQSVTRSP